MKNKTSSPLNRRRIKGVTLIELLICVAISSIIALSLYSALAAGILTSNRMDSAFGVYRNARILLNRLGQDLACAFIYSAENSGFGGGAGRLAFFSTVESFENGKSSPGICRLSYTFENGALTRVCYRGMDALKEIPDSPVEKLSSGIKELSFEYAAASEDPRLPYNWQDTWPKPDNPKQKNSLPLAVKIKFSLIERDRSKETAIIEFSRIVPLHIDP